MFVVKPPIYSVKSGDSVWIALLSDMHIGSAFVDYGNLKADLDRARALNARISINGDVFDFILPKDSKRFEPTTLHPDLRGRTDVVNASIELAVKILSPYADLIDFIGCGNHETVISKYHSVDAIKILIHELNAHYNGKIEFGGYTGWLVYQFARNTERWSYKISYHHGSGGQSPMSKGMGGFYRKSTWIDGADCIWHGHQHNKTVDRDVVQTLDQQHRLKHIERLRIMTGSYMDTYREQSQADYQKNGRVANYAEEWNVAPQSHGGVFVRLDFNTNKPISAKAEI